MIERDKKYYNKKISELYAVIENQEKIIRDLQEKNSKVIEYIDNWEDAWYSNTQQEDKENLIELLKILKGEE